MVAPVVPLDLALSRRALLEEERLKERKSRELIQQMAAEARWLEKPPLIGWAAGRGWLMAKVEEVRFFYDGETWTCEELAEGHEAQPFRKREREFTLETLNRPSVLDEPVIPGTGLLGKACQSLKRLYQDWKVMEVYECDTGAVTALTASCERSLSESEDEVSRVGESDEAAVRRVLETGMDEACGWTLGELEAVGRHLKWRRRQVSAVLPIWHTGRKLWDAENRRQREPELPVVLTKEESRLIGRAMNEESHWMHRFVKELDALPVDALPVDAGPECRGWVKAVIVGVDFCFDGKGWIREVADDEDEWLRVMRDWYLEDLNGEGARKNCFYAHMSEVEVAVQMLENAVTPNVWLLVEVYHRPRAALPPGAVG